MNDKVITINEWLNALALSRREADRDPNWRWPFPPGPTFPRYPHSYVNVVIWSQAGEDWLKQNNISHRVQTRREFYKSHG